MAPDPDIDTTALLGTPAVPIITTDAEEGYTPYSVAYKHLSTTNFNSSLVFCAFNTLISRT